MKLRANMRKPQYVQSGGSTACLLALAIDLAVAELLVGAVDGIHAENDMPQELHDSS